MLWNSFTAVRAWSLSSAFQISAKAFFAAGWADFGSDPSTLAILWNQHRWALVCGNTSPSAAQNPSAPSPTASTGARIPRRLHDTTVRRHWEKARKVNISGERVTLDPDGPLAEAAWAKHRVGRATQTLPNGYCGLPAVKTCPHANACLTCPMFITTREFLPQHRQQREHVIQIISAAEARGQQRLAEMNQQVLGNLNRIIHALDQDDEAEAADAG